MVGRSTVLKLKKEQMLEFPIPESHFDTEVKKTSSTCLNLNAKKLTCNMNNIIDFNHIVIMVVLRITAWILRFICNLKSVKTQIVERK